MQQRRGCLTQVLLALVLGGAVVYVVIAALNPWALHIGGRSTPLLYWQGSGKLHTKDGHEYLLWVYLYPSSHFSRLAAKGMRPTGGVTGQGLLCTSRGVTQQLRLGGTIYNGWRSTEGSLISFRLNEPKYIDLGQAQGYFDLSGSWRGPQLVMEGRDNTGARFRSGLTIDHPSVTLDWDTASGFKAVCASMPNNPVKR